jgi:hypothetical protein
VAGVLVNQPPKVSVSPPQTIECGGHGGGEATLTATGSDPDNNARLYTWLRDRVPPVLGVVETLRLTQAAGTTQRYTVRLIDAFAQADEASTQVTVTDTRPPQVTASFGSAAAMGETYLPSCAATDLCDPAPAITAQYLGLPELEGCKPRFLPATGESPPGRVEVEVRRTASACRVEVTGKMGPSVWASMLRDGRGAVVGVPVASGVPIRFDQVQAAKVCRLGVDDGRLTWVSGSCARSLVCVAEDAAKNRTTETVALGAGGD